MKVTLLAALLVFRFANAESPIRFGGMVNVSGLGCETMVGEGEETRTILKNPTIVAQGSIELRHKLATGGGCDLQKLKEIVDKARSTFNYAEASFEVIRERKAKDDFGLCSQNISEQLQIDLGDGIVLISKASQKRNVRPCQ